jgi:hypothetical protein
MMGHAMGGLCNEGHTMRVLQWGVMQWRFMEWGVMQKGSAAIWGSCNKEVMR